MTISYSCHDGFCGALDCRNCRPDMCDTCDTCEEPLYDCECEEEDTTSTNEPASSTS